MINLARNVGGSCEIAMANTLLARRAQFHQQNLVSHLTPMDAWYNDTLQGIANVLLSRGSDTVQAMNQVLGVLYGMVRRQAMMNAFLDNFWLLGLAFLAMIPLIFIMKSAGAHKADGAAATH
jgi:DHA2 family multidrug resistance protein